MVSHSIPEQSSNDQYQFCKNLLQRMTLNEKIGQMVQIGYSTDESFRDMLRKGQVGSLLTISDPEIIDMCQHITVEESRLGIPLIIGNDVIHGFRTIFPIPLALASTWDIDLIEAIGRASMIEAVPHGTHWTFAPMVNIARDPRWGRIAEGAGEDPLLGSRIAQAWVKGFQSYVSKSGNSAAACVKHYAAYGGAEAGKDYNSVDMSERRLRDEYLPPYRAAVQAGVKTLMTSFNDLNGIPATANPFLLKQVLRQEWGFDGVVITDYNAIGELIYHGFAKNLKEAALKSFLAGVDMDMVGYAFHRHLAELVYEGKILEADIDRSVMRILRLKYDLGLFENPYPDLENAQIFIGLPETVDLAIKAVEESIILVKNQLDILPLSLKYETIALIGPVAHERQSLIGTWGFAGKAEETQTFYEAMIGELPDSINIIYNQGCTFSGKDDEFSQALDKAKSADLIILTLGEPDWMSGEAHSRADISLPGNQQQLADQIVKLGKPTIAVVFTGRPLVIPELLEKMDAVLIVWHGGTYAAKGLVNVLLGKVNPSGKTPTTFPRSIGQIPIYFAHKSTGRPVSAGGTKQFTESYTSSYIDESNEPLIPFGFGLSYTKFTYSKLFLSSHKLLMDEPLIISILISNTGSVAGTEIVQLYVRDVIGSVTRPVKELKDFQRVTLLPGESRQVTFTLTSQQLSFHGIDMQPTTEPGDFRVWVGPNSIEGLQDTFEIVREG